MDKGFVCKQWLMFNTIKIERFFTIKTQITLNKKFENLGKSLSKSQQKSVSGGLKSEIGGQRSCSVSCSTGFYACCYRNIIVTYCNCVANGRLSPNKCDAGGAGASDCSISF
jgi:hypothetical protein